MTRSHVRRRLGDRRTRARFEIVGELAGTLEAVVPVQVRDVGSEGALLESSVGLQVASVHRLTYEIGGMEASVDACVCHLRAVTLTNGESGFLVGVEFLRSHPVLALAIEQWLQREPDVADVSGV